MEPKTYNGWTNYETWCVALWLDNDCGTYHHYQQLAQSSLDDADDENKLQRLGMTSIECAVYELSKRIKQEVEEAQPEVHGLYADLLGAALSEVNWFEIASHYLDDVLEKEVERETQYHKECNEADEAIEKLYAAQDPDFVDE